MFDKEFYPTPKPVFDKMWTKVDKKKLPHQTLVLEPSAGKGDLLDYVESEKDRYKSYEFHVIEPNPELQMILTSKDYKVVWNDFLTFETFNEYNLIIANPPFSNGDAHLMKMITLAEKQYTDCQIVCLLNAETIKNPFSKQRQALFQKLSRYHAEIEYVENAFSEAERKTNVEVAIVYLNIVKNEERQSVLNDLKAHILKNKKDDGEENEASTELSTFVHKNELSLKKEDIELYLELHHHHCVLEKERYKLNLEAFVFEEFEKNNVSQHLPYGYNDEDKIREEYKKSIRAINRVYWKKVLYLPEIQNRLTEKTANEIYNKIIEQDYLDFNYENIQLLLGSIILNQGNLIVESIESFFDEVTSYSNHKDSQNIHYYNGWKTNDAFKINYKIILPYLSFMLEYKTFDSIDDVGYKIMNFIKDIYKLLKLFKGDNIIQQKFVPKGNREFENDILRFKIFKKGTIHFWFKDKTLIDKINYVVGQKRSWLPNDDEIKTDPKAREFIEGVFGKKESSLLLENNELQKLIS